MARTAPVKKETFSSSDAPLCVICTKRSIGTAWQIGKHVVCGGCFDFVVSSPMFPPDAPQGVIPAIIQASREQRRQRPKRATR